VPDLKTDFEHTVPLDEQSRRIDPERLSHP